MSELEVNKNYWLGEDADESWRVFFLRKQNDGEIRVYRYVLVDYDEQRDDAYEHVDLYEERKEEVQNGNTEDGYNRWSEDVDIWDYFSPSSFYDYPQDVWRALDNMGYLNNGECPNYDDCWVLDESSAEDLLSKIRTDDESYFDSELFADIQKEYHLNEMTFIQTLPIH